MRLGLVLGYGNAFGEESVQWGGGGTPPLSSDSLGAGVEAGAYLTPWRGLAGTYAASRTRTRRLLGRRPAL